MSLDAFETFLTVAANISLIVSVVFLALQLRAATKAQRAMSAWQAENLWSRFNLDIGSNPALADTMDLVFGDASAADAADPRAMRQAHFVIRGMLQVSQSQFFLYREGSLPSENWETEREWLRIFLHFPLVESVLAREIREKMLTPMFLEELHSAGALPQS